MKIQLTEEEALRRYQRNTSGIPYMKVTYSYVVKLSRILFLFE
jgi:hypothetical protein